MPFHPADETTNGPIALPEGFDLNPVQQQTRRRSKVLEQRRALWA